MDNPFSDDFIERYRAGDEEAEISLWKYGREHCIPFLCDMGLSYADAQDIWYEAYFNFFESKCPTFDPTKGLFVVWLRTVIKNLARYELRKRRRFPHEPLDEAKQLTDNSRAQKRGGDSEMVLLAERARELLGKSHERVISLRFDEDLSFSLIAERLGISESAARMRVSRGLQKLRLISRGLKSGELPRQRNRIRRTNPHRATPPGES
jgi:RNA polymerase sigma-70 factor (ECF subfamily)